MDFNKYCNCYSQPYGKISVECYDTILEAIHKHESRPDDKSVDSRLVIMKKFWPQFIQKIIVQNEFRKPVVFIPKLLHNINNNNE
jgi:hypothetical protein